MVLADATGTGAIGLYIADVEGHPDQPVEVPVERRHLPLHRLLPPAGDRPVGVALPGRPVRQGARRWRFRSTRTTGPATPRARSSRFACTGSGVAAKCARNWGYKPWKTVNETVWNGAGFAADADPARAVLRRLPDRGARRLLPGRPELHEERHAGRSVRHARRVHVDQRRPPGSRTRRTRPGVDAARGVSDLALDLATFALPVRPFYASAGRAHEPAARRSARRCSAPAPLGHAVEPLRRSRSRAARAWRRPTSIAAIRRSPTPATARPTCRAQPYGAFLAVNSPRHCAHDEDHAGEPLDPLCNECVNRVCQIDPTCCGDPGSDVLSGQPGLGRPLQRPSGSRSAQSGPADSRLWPPA